MLLRPRQKTFVERSVRALDEHGNTLGVAPTGCHAPGTPILMFDGTVKPVEAVTVGDRLMGPDGRQRRVLELHRGRDDMVEIRPLEGEAFVVNAGHVLSLVKTNDGTVVNLAVRDYLRSSGTFRHRHELYRARVDLDNRHPPIRRTGFTTHAAGEGDYFGFTVDGDHLYLMGDFTVTHNSGKTVMLSGLVGQMLAGNDAKACVLAHRDELTAQNVLKFAKINPDLSTSIVDSRTKSWRGRTTFAMVPTLARKSNLDAMPALDLLVVDEAHHAAADSYRRIIDRARERNPDVRIYGVTATPNRGDKKGLRPVFSNVADQILLGEPIGSGHLVRPRTFVIDVGTQEALKQVRKTVDDFDMKAVDAIMNKAPITEAVIAHWREKASDRQTVIFCSTVDHARNVRDAFVAAGIDAEMVWGEMPESERRAALAAYRRGETRVMVNVAVLTEGWDHPPTSCVVLLRPSSYKATMIQMVGRGLRTIDPTEFPGVVKVDCLILDFGTSSLMHGTLEQDIDLDGREADGDALTKVCPECDAIVPLAVLECPLCGHQWPWEGDTAGETIPLGDFVMSEIDLLKRSSFRWCDLFGDDAALVANGFHAWGGIFFLNGNWHALGGAKGQPARLLGVGARTVCLAAADDWLNENETDESAHKSKAWLNQPATEKQLRYLSEPHRRDYGLTRYTASALLTFQFNKQSIRRLVMGAADETRRAA